MTVVGFDPGLNRTGYAIIKDTTPVSVLTHGVIIAHPNQPLNQRFALIFSSAQKILQDYRPEVVTVEEVYFAKNPQTTLKIGIVRGLLFAAALEQKIEVVSFSPAEVKMAVSGKGNATKEQVQYLTAAILGLKENIPEDSADALALCLCYLSHLKYQKRLQDAK